MAPTNEEGPNAALDPANDPANDPEGPALTTLRTRWATRKMTIKSSNKKRLSIMHRAGHKKHNSEKSRNSGGTESLQTEANTATDPEEGNGGRKMFFNLPLPAELLDEEGHPSQHFPRNKIRTAKYTPISFVPKNLWFQFQNIANIFFLFLVILVVSRTRGLPQCMFELVPTLCSSSPFSAVRIQVSTRYL